VVADWLAGGAGVDRDTDAERDGTQMTDLWCYSDDEESYRGRFVTKEAAIHEATAEGLKRFWVGKCDPPVPPENYWDAEDWLERVSEQDDYSGEWAEDWDHSTKKQHKELEVQVRAVMAAWLDRYSLRPDFYNVTQVERYEIP